MIILEFDKNKVLRTPFSTTYYNEEVFLDLKFEERKLACEPSINSITLNIYKKGERNANGLLVTIEPSSFFRESDEEWKGRFYFTSEKLENYIHESPNDIGLLDGQFEFVLTNDVVFKTNFFFTKIIHKNDGSLPPSQIVYPDLDYVLKMMSEHDISPTAHTDLFENVVRTTEKTTFEENVSVLKAPVEPTDVIRKKELDEYSSIITKEYSIDDLRDGKIIERGFADVQNVFIDENIAYVYHVKDEENGTIIINIFNPDIEDISSLYGNGDKKIKILFIK